MAQFYQSGTGEIWNSNGDMVASGSGWGRSAPPRSVNKKPDRLPADENNGTNSEINSAARKVYEENREFMIGMSWYNLYGFCMKMLPSYDASQVIFSLAMSGKLIKVFKDSSGDKQVAWRTDLIQYKKLIEQRAYERCEYEHSMLVNNEQAEEVAQDRMEQGELDGEEVIDPESWGPRDAPNQEESEMEECLDTIEKKNSLLSKAKALRSKAEAEGWYLGPLTPEEEVLQEEGQASLKKQLEEIKKQLDEL